ncbi:serine hydrolase [Sporosarcina gallistercoris]|uniref:serine hydrolase n=1 Tax=Sporosarcina gallistercoris TaxID=2762245 RepID=UPI003D2AADE3
MKVIEYIQLEHELNRISNDAAGDVSLYAKTPDGTIAIRPNEVIRSASILKVPVAMACLAAADRGEIDLDTLLKIVEPVGGSGVLAYLTGVEDITLRDALTLSIIVSDNTAANLVIDHIGLECIQSFFRQVGVEHSLVSRKFMDYDALAKGFDNVATAREMVLFLQCLDPASEFLSLTSKQLLKMIMRDQQLIDKLPAYQPIFNETLIIGNKTGSLPGIEHDIAYFEKDNRRVDIAVLTSNWVHNHDGQKTIAAIGQAVIEYL